MSARLDRYQVVSLLLLVSLVFVLLLEGAREFGDAPANEEEVVTPPDVPQHTEPEAPASAPMNWDPSWRYERRYA